MSVRPDGGNTVPGNRVLFVFCELRWGKVSTGKEREKKERKRLQLRYCTGRDTVDSGEPF